MFNSIRATINLCSIAGGCQDGASCVDAVSPGARFFPGLQHGTSFELRPNLAWLKVEVKDRFTGFHRSPQQAESLTVAGANTT